MEKPQKIAYIVANDQYETNKQYSQFMNLPGVEAEITEKQQNNQETPKLVEFLSQLKFEVNLFRNVQIQDQNQTPGFNSIIKKIELDVKQSEENKKNSIILFIYLGHGATISENNDTYAITSDLKLFSLDFIPQLSSISQNTQIVGLIDCGRTLISEQQVKQMGINRYQIQMKEPARNYSILKIKQNCEALDYFGLTETFKQILLKNISQDFSQTVLEVLKTRNDTEYQGNLSSFKI